MDARHDHACEITTDGNLGIDATRELSGESFKRPWLPLIKMDQTLQAKVEILLRGGQAK